MNDFNLRLRIFDAVFLPISRNLEPILEERIWNKLDILVDVNIYRRVFSRRNLRIVPMPQLDVAAMRAINQ